jgi:hypothetical protein
MLGVWLMVAIPYRSAVAGFCALIPVCFSILLSHSVMGFAGIPLGVGTSMSAEIAIGVGVDFGIHTLERLRHLVGKGYDMRTALERLFPSTGRTLLFMFLALVLGVSATLTSAVPSIVSFGTLFVGALIVTFISSLTLLPAVLSLLQPRFLCGDARESSASGGLRAASLGLAAALIWGSPDLAGAQNMNLPANGYTAFATAPAGYRPPARQIASSARAPAPENAASVPVAAPAPVAAVAPPSTPAPTQKVAAAAARTPAPGAWPAGIDVARKINARDEGLQLSRTVDIELMDKSGKTRNRTTRGFRRAFGDERRLVVFYEEPKSVEGTAFLTRDYPERDRDDDQWLYLPASGKVRRVATADRGAYFLETDFTYDDLTRDTKVNVDDYNWKTIGFEQYDGRPCYVVESIPVDAVTAKELGYGRLVSYVDSEIFIIRKVEYSDPSGNPLKTFRASDIRQVQGIWTPHRLEVENQKTGHRTVFAVTNVDYKQAVRDDLFEQRALPRGLR